MTAVVASYEFGEEVAMLRKKSVAEALLRDMQGSAAEELALFEKLKAREDLLARIAQ